MAIQIELFGSKKKQTCEKICLQIQEIAKKGGSEKALPKEYIVQMFIGDLQENVALLVLVKDPETLDDAISAIKKIEARSYYRNIAVRKKEKSNNNWRSNINELVQQIQEIKISYNKLAT
ncbi:18102_t:CDS:1, partial [Racocetra persica]